MSPCRLRRARAAVAVMLVVLTGCGGRDAALVGGRPASDTTATAAPAPAANRDTTVAPADGTPATTADDDDPAGVGDPLFPTLGNRGYDVASYDLELAYAPDSDQLDGTVSVRAAVTATTPLTTFHLDLAGFDVGAVTVDGAPATTAREGEELVVTPAVPLAPGATFSTVVGYRGTPSAQADPSLPGFSVGWVESGDQSFMLSEPGGAHRVFPCNDHPSDKATYTFELTVPSALTAVANGVATGKEAQPDGTTTWSYAMNQPMASYLVQIAIGPFEVIEGTAPNGVPLRHAVVPGAMDAAQPFLDLTGTVLDAFDDRFGPYPYAVAGLLIADSQPGLALETQTLPIFSAADVRGGVDDQFGAVVAHELAHQWFGDAVTPARWQDVWLNEGFATYAQWLWQAGFRPDELGAIAASAYPLAKAGRERDGAPTEVNPATMFSASNVYDGGAIVLYALGKEVGEDTLEQILRTWVAEHDGDSVTTADFIATASDVSGRDLTTFFDRWLFADTLPPLPT